MIHKVKALEKVVGFIMSLWFELKNRVGQNMGRVFDRVLKFNGE